MLKGLLLLALVLFGFLLVESYSHRRSRDHPWGGPPGQMKKRGRHGWDNDKERSEEENNDSSKENDEDRRRKWKKSENDEDHHEQRERDAEEDRPKKKDPAEKNPQDRSFIQKIIEDPSLLPKKNDLQNHSLIQKIFPGETFSNEPRKTSGTCLYNSTKCSSDTIKKITDAGSNLMVQLNIQSAEWDDANFKYAFQFLEGDEGVDTLGEALFYFWSWYDEKIKDERILTRPEGVKTKEESIKMAITLFTKAAAEYEEFHTARENCIKDSLYQLQHILCAACADANLLIPGSTQDIVSKIFISKLTRGICKDYIEKSQQMPSLLAIDNYARLKEWMVRLPLQNLSLIHISEPTRLLSISYAVFCLKKKKEEMKNNA
eukprot:TRINITY_DN10725_c0_g1_i1.p1 TRINITY_DN10725_c0_g1~~TRINITY_DN10725_c0_g1_i1.p1  ORF type:complete len:375 (-),score=59.96 TRINITY_DN10725_c0_g1_i1:14-1138(-)